MYNEDLFSSFVENYNSGDIKSSMNSLMKELGNILVRKKEDFVDLLNESGISANSQMSDSVLVDLFIQNIDTNPKLALGSSILVNQHNCSNNFDGEEELDDDAVKAGFDTIKSYFYGDDYSNGAGLATAIAQGVTAGANLGSTIAQGQQKKKYGALDIAAKRQEAKDAITQQIIANKQAELEQATKQKEIKSKNTRTLLIVSGVIVGLGVLGYIIYKTRK